MKKNLLDKNYDANIIEKKWYTYWEEKKLFAINNSKNKKKFSIVLPPPNITGILHMGHALNNTLQDILCRYRRSRGDSVLWIPGTDHAGIATQNVVEKKLKSQGLDRKKLGRKKFIKSILEWKKLYGQTITKQMRRLGTSCNWDKERFTLDKGLSIAVRKVFVELYNDGLIYKNNYVTNWCPRCQTALSDLEVNHEKCKGKLYKIKYPYAKSPGHLIIATTRPETMLGDVAIAINPSDDRYNNLKDNNVLVPLIKRNIPIIKDKYVDKSFGTGVLKITPAHDPNDFEIGTRHNLPSLKVIDEKGMMNSNAGEFKGLDRYECRKTILENLEKEGLLVGIKSHEHNLGHCYRCKTTIESNLSEQWFIKTKSLAQKAIKVVKDKEIKIFPTYWTKTYYEWLKDIKDWCISRQIWWGHQIPAWTCNKCKKIIVAEHNPLTCTKCSSTDIDQDPDVLDTWFSSALWPFSTLGWPQNNDLFNTFYPTSVLITGFDILFFWVARMIMLGLYVTKKVPFKNVYIHALIRDNEGKKMSKSKGNVIDPIKIINKYGTDAFRFTLSILAAQGRDIKLSEKKIQGYSHFVNKIWNAARLVFPHLGTNNQNFNNKNLSIADYWIMQRFEQISEKVSISLKNYKFNEAANYLYHYVWHEFCDWYLEIIKPILYNKLGQSKKTSTISVVSLVFKDLLIILHPFMPFLTEELWHKLPGTKDSIMKAHYPDPNSYHNKSIEYQESEKDMNFIIQLITKIRNIRSEMNLSPAVKLDILYDTNLNSINSIMKKNNELITNMANLNKLEANYKEKKVKYSITILLEKCTIFVLLKDLIDSSKEKILLNKKKEKIDKKLIEINGKLKNDNFLKKAPLEIIKKVKIKYSNLIEKKNKINNTLNKINKINE